jgi:hypothetical protein
MVKASDPVRYSCLVVESIQGHKFCPPKKTTWNVDGRVNLRLRFHVAAVLADILKGKMSVWIRSATLRGTHV